MRAFTVTDEVREYAVARGSRHPDDVVARLRAETLALGRASGMQIGDDQAQLLTLLTGLVGARRAVEVAVKRAPEKEAPRPPIKRRDATGHLDPTYAADLRARSGHSDKDDDDLGFLSGPRSDDDLAEELGEEAVESMTSGEDRAEEAMNETVEEEAGGPFVASTGVKEFAHDIDESNPEDALREPFPTT